MFVYRVPTRAISIAKIPPREKLDGGIFLDKNIQRTTSRDIVREQHASASRRRPTDYLGWIRDSHLLRSRLDHSEIASVEAFVGN